MHLNTRHRVREDQQRMCAMHTHAVTNALTTTTTTSATGMFQVKRMGHGKYVMEELNRDKNQIEVPSLFSSSISVGVCRALNRPKDEMKHNEKKT